MKMSKAKKRVIFGFVGMLLVGTIFLSDTLTNITDVQATTNVLKGLTTKYTTTNQVKILEIVPTAEVYTSTFEKVERTININAELGYFMPWSSKEDKADYDADEKGADKKGGAPAYIGFTSRGGVHGAPASGQYNENDSDEVKKDAEESYKQLLVNLREYGLVMPYGTDRGWFTHIGEYPIYGRRAVFSNQYGENTPNELNAQFVKGVYSLTDNGDYFLDEQKYTLNNNHEICTVTWVEGDNSSVSANGGTVSGSDLSSQKPSTSKPTVSINGIVTDIDPQIGLPRSTDNTIGAYITKVTDGTGNVSFVEADDTTDVNFAQYYGYSSKAVFYEAMTNYHKNSDWFSEYVFGSNKTYKDVDADYIVKDAPSVTVDDIKEADLVYISGTAAEFKNNDISKEVMLALYNKQINYKHLAIMMDYAVYAQDSATNISLLAVLLWQESHSDLLTAHSDIFVTSNDTEDPSQILNQIVDAEKLNQDIINELKATMLTDALGNGNFVTGNVYVYNHHMADFEDPKSMVDAYDIFANGDFTSAYKSDIAATGLKNVVNYVIANNKDADDGGVSTSITPAIVIQYILISDGQPLTMMKSSLRVLEIQPVPAYLYNTGRGSEEYLDLDENNADDARVIANREKFVEDYLTNYYQDRIKYVSFTSMTVSEFNGRNEDLVESYDIVYIGDETHRKGKNLYYESIRFVENSNVTPQNAKRRATYEWNDSLNKKGGYEEVDSYIPVYNSPDLLGNIYYNIGDTISVFTHKDGRGNLFGYLDSEMDANGNVIKYGDFQRTFEVRFNGRDITKNKLKKMEEFLQADGLVIVAENLLGRAKNSTITDVNPTVLPNASNADTQDIYGRVDSASNLYEFLQFGLGRRFDSGGTYVSVVDPTNPEAAKYDSYPNMVAASDIKLGNVNKESLNKYVASERLSLILMERPVEYSYAEQTINYNNNMQFNVIDANNVNYLSTRDNVTGTRYLYYKFSITSEMSAAENVGVYYTPRLYIDINNDGKYSTTTENVSDCVVTVDGTGEEAAKDEQGNYRLEKDVVYCLRRDLSSVFSGIVKWKLDIQSVLPENSHISESHISEQGYTLVKNESGKKTQIKVLQVTKTNNSYLNLETQLENQLKNQTTLWGPYLVNIPDYELHIDTINVDQFIDDFTTAYRDKGAGRSVEQFAIETYFKEYKVESIIQGDKADLEGVDMLVLGFGDNYPSINNYQAVSAIKAFIEAGNPTLMAHDVVSFSAEVLQNKGLRQLVGMDVYGVSQNISGTVGDVTLSSRWGENGELIPVDGNTLNGSLHVGTNLTRSGNKDSVLLVESLDKEIAYVPNSGGKDGHVREAISKDKQAYSNFLIEWQKDYIKSNQSWLNSPAVNKYGVKDRKVNPNEHNGWRQVNNGITGETYVGHSDFSTYTVEKLNDGQITEYPYRIPQSFVCQVTHSQYYSLDLTSDSDKDGESDVVVWYALGDTGIIDRMGFDENKVGGNPYSDSIGGSLDPANGYFIYNKGNVTYTGAGDSNLESESVTEEERQLFVNTLLAAYKVGNVAPEVAFYETADVNEEPITSFTVPYDENVTNPALNNNAAGVDSSVLKDTNGQYEYKFVDPNTNAAVNKADGTPLFFRVKDTNLVRGTRTIETKFYLKVDETKLVDENGGTLEAGEKEHYIITNGVVAKVEPLLDGVKVVDISQYIDVYKTTNTGTINTAEAALTKNPTTYATDGIQSGDTYGIYLPMSYLNENAGFTIYIEAKTQIETVSTAGITANTTTDVSYADFSVLKADLLDLE